VDFIISLLTYRTRRSLSISIVFLYTYIFSSRIKDVLFEDEKPQLFHKKTMVYLILDMFLDLWIYCMRK